MLKSGMSLSSSWLFHQCCHFRSTFLWRSGGDFFEGFVECVGVPKESQLSEVFVYDA